MKQRIPAILCCLAMIASLTSCQGGDPAPAQSSTAPPATSEGGSPSGEAAAEPVSLSVLISTSRPVPPDVDPNDNQWANRFKDALPHIDIDWVITPESAFQEKKNILIGSGAIPDVMAVNDFELINFSTSGIIQPVTDYITEEYIPNVMMLIGEDAIRSVTYEGEMWAYPTPRNAVENQTAMFIRQDWLDNLGLDTPTNTEELYEVMRAFTFDDPDGNGQDDTFGYITAKNLGWTNSLMLAFDVYENTNDNVDRWTKVDGQLLPDIIRPEMKEYLTYMARLYADGIYDKESLAFDFKQLEEKVISGKVGVWISSSSGTSSRYVGGLKQAVPTGEIAALEPPTGPNGSRGMFKGTSVGTRWAVSATCDHPEAVADILDWMLTLDDSVPYIRYNADQFEMGDMGEHATVIGDRFMVALPESDLTEDLKKDNYRNSYLMTWSSKQILPDDLMIELKEAQVQEGLSAPFWPQVAKYNLDYAVMSEKYVTGPVESEYWYDLKSYFDEVKMKIVIGSESPDSFDKWVQYFYDNGGQDVIDEVNKLN